MRLEEERRGGARKLMLKNIEKNAGRSGKRQFEIFLDSAMDEELLAVVAEWCG